MNTNKWMLAGIIFIFGLSVGNFAEINAQEEAQEQKMTAEEIKAKKKAAIKKKLKKKKSKKARTKAKKKKIQRKSAVKVKKAQKKKKSRIRKSLQAWLKKMKKRVARSQAKHNQLVSVAAVRGDKKADAPPLYWKGKKAEGPVDLPELREFDEAIGTALNGNKTDAVTKLEAFVTKYPQSSLVQDANHTLAMLTQEESEKPVE